MFWEHGLTSTISCVRQLLQGCNLILPTEMPASTAAGTSTTLKQTRQKTQVRRSLACIHHGCFGFPDPTGTCNHTPAAVPLVVMSVPQCVTQAGTPQHTLHAWYLWFHCVTAHIHHVCSQPSLTQAFLPACESILSAGAPCPRVWEAKTRDACLCQGFPRWRDLTLLKPFQSMFAREVSIISPFWHVPGLQLWSTIFP